MSTSESLPCLRCEEPSKKQLSASRTAFRHVSQTATPQNTGATSTDYSPDRVIGQNAWCTLHEMQKRSDYKRSVIESENTDGHHLSRDPEDGSYWVMSDEQLLAAKKGREVQKVLTRAVREFESTRKRL